MKKITFTVMTFLLALVSLAAQDQVFLQVDYFPLVSKAIHLWGTINGKYLPSAAQANPFGEEFNLLNFEELIVWRINDWLKIIR